jgi:3-oxoadipate enol-lactonase
MPQEVINGYRMYYEVYGQGPALAMVHGGLGGGEGCSQMVEHHAAILGQQYQLVFFDRRAAGRSETPNDGYSMQNQTDDLRALLGHLGVSKASVLGSSAGGPIAMRFALDYPDMIENLILVNTMSYVQKEQQAVRQRELDQLKASEASLGKEAAVECALESRYPGLSQAQPDQFRKLREINLQQFDGLAKTIQSYLDIGDSIESRLSELTLPTLVVHGDADSRIPVDCGRQLHQSIAGSDLHIIPGAEHGLMTNSAERVRDLIINFMEQAAEKSRKSARV